MKDSQFKAGIDMDKLLFIDDDLSILKTLKAIMHREGYQLFFANNADKASTIIKQNDIAVIIADNKMPGTSGLDFLSEARERSPYSVRVMLSGDCDQQCTIKSINLAQVYKFISKPFAGTNLKNIIRNAVKKFHESKLIADLSNNNLNLIQVIQQFALNKNSENILKSIVLT